MKDFPFKTTAKTCWKAAAVTFYSWNKVTFARKTWLTLTYHNSCANFASLFKFFAHWIFKYFQVSHLGYFWKSRISSQIERKGCWSLYPKPNAATIWSKFKQLWRRIPNSWLRCHLGWRLGENKTNSFFATGENPMQWCREPQSKRGRHHCSCSAIYSLWWKIKKIILKHIHRCMYCLQYILHTNHMMNMFD